MLAKNSILCWHKIGLLARYISLWGLQGGRTFPFLFRRSLDAQLANLYGASLLNTQIKRPERETKSCLVFTKRHRKPFIAWRAIVLQTFHCRRSGCNGHWKRRPEHKILNLALWTLVLSLQKAFYILDKGWRLLNQSCRAQDPGIARILLVCSMF